MDNMRIMFRQGGWSIQGKKIRTNLKELSNKQ